MIRRTVLRVLVPVMALASAAGAGGQALPPGQVPFQSGIDIVLVDVTVLGRGASIRCASSAPAGRWRGPLPERPARRRLRCRPKPAASSS